MRPRAPEVRVFEAAGKAAGEAAERIARLLLRRPSGVLVLASGKTMVPVYRELVRRAGEGRASFSRATTFNLDELAVPAADPRSFRTFMDRHLFSRVNLEEGRIRFLRGDARDAAAECARYEDEFARAGPADIALVGIGPNGHVAYLEPGESLAPVTSAVRLSAQTRRTLAADGVVPPPRRALTMGIETILSAKAILLVATGRSKAEAVAKTLRGPVTARCPASYLSLHPRLTLLLDRAAAREL
ncbi:MAG: glucosamine-6-phosphate deaminase [Acidobacteriota bacterium]